jgi:HEAT repeat protein
VAGSEKGRYILIEDEIIPKIRDLFNDHIVKIRANAYNAMISIAEYTFGIDSVISFNIIPVLVDKLNDEKNQEILILILTLLKILIEGDAAPLVIQGSDVLPRLNHHLQSDHFKIRELAALNLGSISYNSLGKE